MKPFLSRTLILLPLLGTLHAAEEKSAASWIEELATTHSKTGGYIATYHSESKGKLLDATVATHFFSGLGAVDIRITKDDSTQNARWWITEDELVYIDPPGPDRLKFPGVSTELRYLYSFHDIRSDYKEDHKPFVTFANPYFVLTADSVESGLKITLSIHPGWKESVKGASVASVDDDQVTFKTKQHGHLSVGRKHGILIRQTFPDHSNKNRKLELTELKLSPDKNALTDLTSEWSILGAVETDRGVLTSAMRFETFQSIITAIEEGDADLGKLETKLKDDIDPLRKFAESSTTEKPGSAAAKLSPLFARDLKIIREKMKGYWLENVAGAKKDDERAFETYLVQPETLRKARDGLVKGILETWVESNEDPSLIMREFFGNNPKATLKASDSAGESAKHLIESALMRAYFEALIERKLSKSWSEREGLD